MKTSNKLKLTPTPLNSIQKQNKTTHAKKCAQQYLIIHKHDSANVGAGIIT